jgi:hypothetical protein
MTATESAAPDSGCAPQGSDPARSPRVVVTGRACQ